MFNFAKSIITPAFNRGTQVTVKMILLCVDDDPEDIELFVDAIKVINGSYTCMIAVNGSEALKKLAITVPDYIFLDINMPVMDGKETLERIRRDQRLQAVPVLILSTSNDSKEAELCRRLGANEWLVKPNSFWELVRRLKTVFDRDYLGSN